MTMKSCAADSRDAAGGYGRLGTNEFIGVGLVDGVEHGFVGQIVPEPGTRAMLAAVAVAIGCLLARKRVFSSPHGIGRRIVR